jgi:hypothetical protein
MNKAKYGWEGHDPSEHDIRRIVLSYAILAPSPHNTQPWIVEFDGDLRMRLFIDTKRLLPESDPELRQVCISHGAFIENLELAARNFGYRTDVELFPGRWPESRLEVEKPLATVELTEDSTIDKDTLFFQIIERETNRRTFQDRPIPPERISKLFEACDSIFVSTGYVSDRAICEDLADFVLKAMEIEVSGQERMAETLQYFRFNNEEIEQFRNGFGIAQSGITGISKKIAEQFLISREKAELSGSSFGHETLKLARKQAFSAPAYGWISTKGNTRMDQVKAGRCYERICLKAAELKIAIQPFSQILSDYREMSDLREELCEFIGISGSHTLQMFFRVGYAEPVPHTPRRPSGEFIRLRDQKNQI